MAEAVLDASAILAVIQNEPGASVVMSALQDAVVLTVNYAEVVSKLVERGATLQDADAAVQKLALSIVDFDLDLARRTGAQRAATKNRGQSLGDRACIALGERQRATVVTSDQRWAGAVPGIDVRLIR
jgi:PIN domain nuclease of toxin-antitoxin system